MKEVEKKGGKCALLIGTFSATGYSRGKRNRKTENWHRTACIIDGSFGVLASTLQEPYQILTLRIEHLFVCCVFSGAT